jgi:hypothetical protein
MKATFEAHRQGDLWQDHCDKLGTATIVTVLQEEKKTPEMLNGRGFEHCDKLTAENYVTVHCNNCPESRSEDTLVACIDAALITEAGHPNATDDDKELIDARYPDLSFAADLPLRRIEEANLLGHFCSVVLNRLRDCESRTEEWKQIIEDYNGGKLVPELYQMRNKRCERTIRTWIEQYLQADYDMFALIHSNWKPTRKRKVSEIESQILLGMLLHPNRVKIDTAIKLLKAQAKCVFGNKMSSALDFNMPTTFIGSSETSFSYVQASNAGRLHLSFYALGLHPRA